MRGKRLQSRGGVAHRPVDTGQVELDRRAEIGGCLIPACHHAESAIGGRLRCLVVLGAKAR